MTFANIIEPPKPGRKTLLVTLVIEVEDLDKIERAEAADSLDMRPDELPGIEDAAAEDLAYCLTNIEPNISRELFAGSNLFARFGRVEVRSAEFI